MGVERRRLNLVVAAFAAAMIAGSSPAGVDDRVSAQLVTAQHEEALELLQELAEPDQERWQRLERRIIGLWSRSGSASADLLLQRGRSALRTGNVTAAIEHLTALVDHAPDFAEGYHARATAYFMANQYGPAMADIQETLRRNSDHFGALSGMGVILEELKMHDAALDAYRAAHAIHPHRPDIKRALERLERRLDGTEL